ncbi:Hpt domain-containing protein [Vibrio sp. RE86]|uniref:Hpt domain-containing protein n=1 Tax=Vibrio sp. RE86 TaxID=2607605 RepID=UPI00149378EC|nr:Hpt domain-containing protein [Vibrio sp. RE86]NOH80999.1 Hpt domain-containing protein [Vibrio sp. RE86]
MYSINHDLFMKSTGAEYYSEKGLSFRAIAIKSLKKVMAEVVADTPTNCSHAHKVKGIALMCGAADAAHVCQKLESYGDIVSPVARQNTLQHIIESLINLCFGRGS